MSHGGQPGGAPLGIIELGAICDRHHAAAMGWFAALGALVRDEAGGERQRLWAEAAHRHAWHAELWSERRPTIPPLTDRPVPDPDPVTDSPVGPGAVVTVYASALGDLLAELDALRGRLDPDLDPSTARVASLVAADLTDLLARIRS